MANEKTPKAKVKTPTPLKRDRQNEEKKLRNRAFRSRVSSAVKAVSASSKEDQKERLNAVYSLVDKGVKKGVFKQNKAARLKSRLTKRVSATA